MKIVRTVTAVFFLVGAVLCSPATAKIMDETDIDGTYFAAEMADDEGSFFTQFKRLEADGAGTLSYEVLFPTSDPSVTETVLYTVFDTGMFSTKENPGSDRPFGSAKGAVSPDGNYLVLGDMVYEYYGHAPFLQFAIKESSGLDNTAMDGGYNLFVFYTAPGAETSVIETAAGTFTADAAGTVSGQLAGTGQLTGAYAAAYTIQENGQMSLTLNSGSNSEAFGDLHGVISSDGNVFVAVETTSGDGTQAFVVGVQQRAVDLNLSDIAGDYFVDDFGYYSFDEDGARDDAAGFLMDLTFSDNGEFTLLDKDATCQSEACSIEECPEQGCPDIGSVIDGTLSANGDHYTYTLSADPNNLKANGRIDLSPDATVMTMSSDLYFGIGLQQTSGSADPGEPTADAGNDQTVVTGATVTLDGSKSEDDGTIESYKWMAVTSDSGFVETITLDDDTAPMPTFTAPDMAGYVTFRLLVTDNDGNTDADSVIITVIGNEAPTADAGEDRTVDEGAEVTLDATGSSDPDDGIIAYSWTQTDGIEVTLESADSAQPTFVAPMVDSATALTFELTVEDTGGLTATDTVTITVNDTDGTGENQAPTADAGKDQTVREGATVTLDGSASSDPENGDLTYAWTQTAGDDVTLMDAASAKATFTAPAVDAETTLTFELTVEDADGLTATDTVDVVIDNDVNGNGMPDGMESNETDMDADGDFDFDDPDSIRFRHVNGDTFIGFYCSAGNLVEVENLSDDDAAVPQNGRPDGVSTPYGVFRYTITGLTPGAEVVVTFVLPEDLPEDARFYKISEANGWQPLEITRGEEANTFTVTLTDGDALTDADGEENGVIVDPSAIVVAEADDDGVVIDDDDDDDDSCFIRTMFR